MDLRNQIINAGDSVDKMKEKNTAEDVNFKPASLYMVPTLQPQERSNVFALPQKSKDPASVLRFRKREFSCRPERS